MRVDPHTLAALRSCQVENQSFPKKKEIRKKEKGKNKHRSVTMKERKGELQLVENPQCWSRGRECRWRLISEPARVQRCQLRQTDHWKPLGRLQERAQGQNQSEHSHRRARCLRQLELERAHQSHSSDPLGPPKKRERELREKEEEKKSKASIQMNHRGSGDEKRRGVGGTICDGLLDEDVDGLVDVAIGLLQGLQVPLFVLEAEVGQGGEKG